MWNIGLIQIQQYYEKLVTQRGDLKNEVKRVNMVDVVSI
jgi:hypothetical protein